jgi:hypothetical protein
MDELQPQSFERFDESLVDVRLIYLTKSFGRRSNIEADRARREL